MAVEKIHFGSYDEHFTFLKDKCMFSISEAREIIDHEREHYLKAKELGYSPIYAAYAVIDSPMAHIASLVDFNEDVSPEDMIKICLAPKKPSIDDKKLAARLSTQIVNRTNSLESICIS